MLLLLLIVVVIVVCCCLQVYTNSGKVFNHTYAPQGSDPNWLGLHKAGRDFASYISVSYNYLEWLRFPPESQLFLI